MTQIMPPVAGVTSHAIDLRNVTSSELKRYEEILQPKLDPITACGVCNKTGKNSRCSRCRLQYYCCKDHQQADYDNHKLICKSIFDDRKDLARTFAYLHRHVPDSEFGGDPFEVMENPFWTHPTLRLLRIITEWYIKNVAKLDSTTAVRERLEESMRLIRYTRGESDGVWQQIPYCMIRLDDDQKAFDTIMSCQGRPTVHSWEWFDTDLPIFHVRGTNPYTRDITMSPDAFNISHMCAFLLLKIKLRLDLDELRSAIPLRKLNMLPNELIDKIVLENVRSPITLARRWLLNGRANKGMSNKLDVQIHKYFQAIKDCCPAILTFLADPRPLCSSCTRRAGGDIADVQLTHYTSLQTWENSTGALNVLRKIFQAHYPNHHFSDNSMRCFSKDSMAVFPD